MACAMLLVAADFPETDELIREINVARAARGLQPIEEAMYLRIAAQRYMMACIEKGRFDHEVLDYYEKAEMWTWCVRNYNWDGRHSYVHVISELLAYAPVGHPTFQSARLLAHIYDDSPAHAPTFYHPNAEYIGVWYEEHDGMYYLVMYLAIRTLKGKGSL